MSERHATMAELMAGLSHIMASPKDDGVLEAIVVRPDEEERLDVPSRRISAAGGVEGDH